MSWKFWNSQNGMGLLEVVIAAGVLSVLMLGVSSMMFNSQQGASSVQKRMDAVQLQNLLTNIFGNSATCNLQTNIIGQAPPGAKAINTQDTTSVPTIVFAGQNIDDTANSSYANGQIQISELKYHSVNLIGAPPTQAQVIIRLAVNVQSTGTTQNVVGGNTLPPMDFYATYNIDSGTNKVTSCGPAASNQPTVVAQTWAGGCGIVGGGHGCSSTYNWNTPFTDANYSVTCSVAAAPICTNNCGGNDSGFHIVGITSKTAGDFTVMFGNGTNNQGEGSYAPSLMCIGVHP